MKTTQIKYFKQQLIELYMRELRFNIIGTGSGLANASLFESPSSNTILKSRMQEIENAYAIETEMKLTRKQK